MLAELYVVSGRDAGKVLTATGPTIFLGRAATNHLRIRDPQASRVHCRIDVDHDGLVLQDQNSGNGTLVNGEQVRHVPLRDGDEIQLGATRIKVLVESEDERRRWGQDGAGSPSEESGLDSTTGGDSGVGRDVADLGDESGAGAVDLRGESGVQPAPQPGRQRFAKPTQPQRARDASPSGVGALREVIPGYRLEARLGGHSRQGVAVYRALQRSLERHVALKVFLPRGPTKKEDVERFLREAKAIARLPHPNIVTIHELLSRGKMRVIVMEYLAGGSLADRLEGQALPLEQLREVGTSLARALAYLHAQSVYHRNIKPSNVLVARGHDTYKLGGFGFATGPAGERAGDTSFLTAPAEGFAFRAPEQLGLDLDAIDARSDVYSLGATLYAAASGQPPFQGETVTELAAGMLRDEPPPLPPRLPAPLRRVISRCLQKDPDARYADGAALLHELAACWAGLGAVPR